MLCNKFITCSIKIDYTNKLHFPWLINIQCTTLSVQVNVVEDDEVRVCVHWNWMNWTQCIGKKLNLFQYLLGYFA